MADDWDRMAAPGRYFARVARGLSRIGDIRLRALGLVNGHVTVLNALRHGDPLSQAELARRAGVEQPTMAQLLARMERDSLIIRTPDPNDRRSSLISLAEDVKAKLPHVAAILQAANEEATAGLSADEIETLNRLLHHVAKNVEAMGD